MKVFLLILSAVLIVGGCWLIWRIVGEFVRFLNEYFGLK